MLYRGEFLQGFHVRDSTGFEEWVTREQERLQHVVLMALSDLVTYYLAHGAYAAGIPHAARLLQMDPLREETHRQFMLLLLRNGQRRAALEQYASCRAVLDHELGVAPTAETTALYECIRAGGLCDGENTPVPPPPRRQPPRAAPPRLPAEDRPPLLGRDAEWARLQEAWAAAAQRPQLVILAGEPGIGKTRLAEELLTWADQHEIITAGARSYAAEGSLAYAPVTAWLRTAAIQAALPLLDDIWLTEVVRLTPEIAADRPIVPPGPVTESWQRQRLFEALARTILGDRQPRILLLDDLQWCDQETLEWLHYLLRFDPATRLLIVATLRLAETPPGHLVSTFLLDLGRGGQVTQIDLGPLDATQTAALAGQLTGRMLDPMIAAYLYHETEGNPLFVVETARAGILTQQQPDLALYADLTPPPLSMLPPTVQAVIVARLAGLSPAAHDLVRLAAIIGRAFTFEVLARTSGRAEEDLLRELDELCQRRILREQGGDAYDFSHDKLREVAYGELSTARRRALHHRVAQALEAVYAADLDPVSGQIAVHYRRAHLPEKAIPYYQRAAAVAGQVYAYAEAIHYLRRGLALLDGALPGVFPPPAQHEMAAQLYESLGDILLITGQQAEAQAVFGQAQAQSTARSPLERSRLARKIGRTYLSQRRYDDALQALATAEQILGPPPDAPAAEWQQAWLDVQLDRMWPYYWMAQWPPIADLIERARPTVAQSGTPLQRGKFLHGLVLAAYRRDRYMVAEETLADARRFLATVEESGDAGQVSEAHFWMGFALLWYGARAEAAHELQQALHAADRTGDVALQAHCLTYLATLARLQGQVAETRQLLTRTLATAQASQAPEYVAMVQANQAWLAWREQNLGEARTQAEAALAAWKALPLVWPFHWTAILPLIGVLLAQDQPRAALDQATALLDPLQQRLPEPLVSEITTALADLDARRPAAAVSHLRRALAVAAAQGYL